MEQLRTAAPGLVGSMGMPPPPTGFSTTSNTSTTGSTTTTTNSNTDTNTTNSSTAPSAQSNPALFSEFMARMMNGLSSGSNPNLPPEQRYSTQLETLASMGFVNREANLQGKAPHSFQRQVRESFIVLFHFILALIATFGDINAAVERLLALNQLSLS